MNVEDIRIPELKGNYEEVKQELRAFMHKTVDYIRYVAEMIEKGQETDEEIISRVEKIDELINGLEEDLNSYLESI